jgi:hypothetical protein
MYKDRKTTTRRRRTTKWNQPGGTPRSDAEIERDKYETLVKSKCLDWVIHSDLVKNKYAQQIEANKLFSMWKDLDEIDHDFAGLREIIEPQWREKCQKEQEEKKKEEAEIRLRVNEIPANADAAIHELLEEDDRQDDKFSLDPQFCETVIGEICENIRKCLNASPPVRITLGDIWKNLKRRRQVEIDRIVARSKAKKAAKSQT